jgi:hypothetical protein
MQEQKVKTASMIVSVYYFFENELKELASRNAVMHKAQVMQGVGHIDLHRNHDKLSKVAP